MEFMSNLFFHTFICYLPLFTLHRPGRKAEGESFLFTSCQILTPLLFHTINMHKLDLIFLSDTVLNPTSCDFRLQEANRPDSHPNNWIDYNLSVQSEK